MQCPAGMKVGGVSEPITSPDGKFMVFLPSDWTMDKKHPVCLFLHGAGGVANVDNIRTQSLTRMLLTQEYAAKVEHIVLIPVAPSRGWLDKFPFVMSLVDMALSELSGDPNRVALAGQSMGGNGAWNLATQHPDRFCAVVPICGFAGQGKGEDLPPALVSALLSKPLWVFHSEDDTIVSVENSDRVVNALKAAGATDATLKYTRYPPGVTPQAGPLVGHASYELAFADEGLWPWMSSHRR